VSASTGASTGASTTASAEALIRALPKVELHVHLEGTLEPELLLELARRNGVRVRFASVEQLRAACDFRGLQGFLDLYYEGMRVLRTGRDFFDLTLAYARRVAAEGARHVEVFFDPQAHTERGVRFEALLEGIDAALREAERELGLSSGLIACFLRDRGPDAAMAALELALPHVERLAGVGLDSAERAHPPAPFRAVFERARAAGLRAVAHAGEEGPADYIWQTLELLRVERIDHGVRCTEDPHLVEHLARTRVPLTMCPLSNVRLRVVERLEQHNLKQLLARGLCVTVNSDDPAYFGGYLGDNLRAAQRALALSDADLVALARNAVEASFLPDARKSELYAAIQEVAARHGAPL
jgi:adenosine deaminase